MVLKFRHWKFTYFHRVISLQARFADLARTEINALIHTDDHPNVVRFGFQTPAPASLLKPWKQIQVARHSCRGLQMSRDHTSDKCQACCSASRQRGALTMGHQRSRTPRTHDHPCFTQVRCFSMERDAQFVYLALERCSAALHDVVEAAPAAGAS